MAKTNAMTMTKRDTKKLRKPETAATFANPSSLQYLLSDDNDKDIDKEKDKERDKNNDKEKDKGFCKPVQFTFIITNFVFFFNLMQNCVSRPKNLGVG